MTGEAAEAAQANMDMRRGRRYCKILVNVVFVMSISTLQKPFSPHHYSSWEVTCEAVQANAAERRGRL